MVCLPDFRTADERQQWFRQNAEHFTATCRAGTVSYKSEHKSLDEARSTATQLAKIMKKTIMLYGVVNSYDQWLENVKPE